MELVNKRRCVIVGAAKIENSELLKKNIFYLINHVRLFVVLVMIKTEKLSLI